MEVLDIDILVRRCLPLAPEQETLLGGHLLNRNVLDGEPGQQGCYTHELDTNRIVYLKIIVQIIPRVILTFPSTISKNAIVIWNVNYLKYSYLQLQWTPVWHPCWRWNRGLCWHWQFCETLNGAEIILWKCIWSVLAWWWHRIYILLTSSCLCRALAMSLRRWPPGAAWAWGHF